MKGKAKVGKKWYMLVQVIQILAGIVSGVGQRSPEVISRQNLNSISDMIKYSFPHLDNALPCTLSEHVWVFLHLICLVWSHGVQESTCEHCEHSSFSRECARQFKVGVKNRKELIWKLNLPNGFCTNFTKSSTYNDEISSILTAGIELV